MEESDEYFKLFFNQRSIVEKINDDSNASDDVEFTESKENETKKSYISIEKYQSDDYGIESSTSLLSNNEDSLCSFTNAFEEISYNFDDSGISQSTGYHALNCNDSDNDISMQYSDIHCKESQELQYRFDVFRSPQAANASSIFSDSSVLDNSITSEIAEKLGEVNESTNRNNKKINFDNIDTESDFDEEPKVDQAADSDDGVGVDEEVDFEEVQGTEEGDPDEEASLDKELYESDPTKWKSVETKKAKSTGISGVSKTGAPLFKKRMGPGYSNCRFSCYKKISHKQRESIFEKFWSIGEHDKQLDYIARHLETKRKDDGLRRVANSYYLMASNKIIKVCQKMFIHTLGIWSRYIKTVNKKLQSVQEGAIAYDKRGQHHNRPKRISLDIRNSVKEHIESFLTIESHYCLKSTNKTYLEEGLSLSAMYRKYKTWMIDTNRGEAASEHLYQEIFNHDYNMAFHKPKKDLCDQCAAYDYLSEQDKTARAPAYAIHLENKRKSRELMAQDKQISKDNTNICSACFDVEQTLTTPRANSSAMYYKRKINVYNFTVFELATCQGHCYVWNETVGGKGANEISSCLWEFIKRKVASGITEFRFYSDNCGAQNRNKMLYSMYSRASKLYKVRIMHRYLEKGHTYNEGDSMHARIENSCGDMSVFTQTQWCDIMRNAKINEPFYQVHEMSQETIYNFRLMANDQKWKTVRLSSLREIIVFPDDTNESISVSVKYDYTGESHIYAIDSKKSRGQKYPLKKQHDEKLQVDKGKKRICLICALLELFQNNIMHFMEN